MAPGTRRSLRLSQTPPGTRRSLRLSQTSPAQASASAQETGPPTETRTSTIETTTTQSDVMTLQSTSVAGATKRKRGTSRGLALAKAIELGKGPVPVIWTDEANTHVGPGSSLWSGGVSKIQRQVAPKTAATWREISEADKMHMRALVLEMFKLPTNDPRIIDAIDTSLMNSHRLWRHKYHKHYMKYKDHDVLNHPHEDVSSDDWKILCERFKNPDWQKKSSINIQNKGKSKVNHISGSKSFARRHYELRDPETEELPRRVNFYKETHFREKAQNSITPTTKENYEKMAVIQDEATTQGLTLSQDEVVDKVLKKRSGYVQGLGTYVKPNTSSRLITSCSSDTEDRLRAEIEEMKKRHDVEQDEMKKKLEESQASSARLEKLFHIFLDKSGFKDAMASDLL